ncbi:glycosyltransferase family 2 protein [Flavobacteriaceae bacterium SZ-1-7]|uniref:glycosyltransferase family 2 protein n=1 Tax=Tamlana sedimenti TaxID=3134126 RepID=UPI003120C662
MEFSVSVIIPVYNGEQFIEKAILSALNQPEVTEVIVVDDGSTDDTQIILEELKSNNPKIKVFHHKNNQNKGRSASRNLGIEKATENYIAFLDADDFYLENRFQADKEKLALDTNIDGIYNAVGYHFYRDATVEERKSFELNMVKKAIKPTELFKALFSGELGHFHVNGLTVKKKVFNKSGLFNERLKVGEDTELFWRMALKCQLKTGLLNTPVAIRGVHDNNVFNRKDLYKTYTIKMYETLFFWMDKNGIKKNYADETLKIIWLIKYKQDIGLIQAIFYWNFLFLNNMKFLFSTLSIKYFPIVRLRQQLFPFLFINRNPPA